MCGSLDACACCRLVSANVCTLTVIEKFTVPGEHRETFGFNKKSFKTMRLRTSPTPSGTLLSGRGEPAAATAARRHYYRAGCSDCSAPATLSPIQASTHPNQASEPRRPSFAGSKQILRRRSNMNWSRGSKEKEDAAQRTNSSKRSCLNIGALFDYPSRPFRREKYRGTQQRVHQSSKGDRSAGNSHRTIHYQAQRVIGRGSGVVDRFLSGPHRPPI